MSISNFERIFMFTWLPMNHLPQPPAKFIQQAHAIAHQHNLPDAVAFMSTPDHRTRSVVKDHTVKQSRCQQSRIMGEDWADWVRTNIVKDFIETGVRVSLPVSDTHGAHTDPLRKWKLYYLLERGGDSAVTKFYREPGYPIVRDQSDEHVICNNLDVLEEIDCVQWPLNQWVLLNTMVIHSVENVPNLRYNLTVSIKPCELSALFNVRESV